MQSKKPFLFLSCLLSLALLVPGITLPFISLQADMNRQAVVNEGKKLINEQQLHPAMASMANQFLDGMKVQGKTRLYDKTRSILSTATTLWQTGYLLVAVLIIAFSVIIPALKLLLLMAALISRKPEPLIDLNGILSKWSMADVFAMGIIIACLAANGTSSQKALLNFNAELHSGFYWFVAYSLFSIASGQLLSRFNASSLQPEVPERPQKS